MRVRASAGLRRIDTNSVAGLKRGLIQPPISAGMPVYAMPQDAELLEAGRRLAEAQGALSVADSTDAALAAAREEVAASREQYQVLT